MLCGTALTESTHVRSMRDEQQTHVNQSCWRLQTPRKVQKGQSSSFVADETLAGESPVGPKNNPAWTERPLRPRPLVRIMRMNNLTRKLIELEFLFQPTATLYDSLR